MSKKVKYRIVRDEFNGFEVQFKPKGLFSAWSQASVGSRRTTGTNTHSSMRDAKKFINTHYNRHFVEPKALYQTEKP